MEKKRGKNGEHFMDKVLSSRKKERAPIVRKRKRRRKTPATRRHVIGKGKE